MVGQGIVGENSNSAWELDWCYPKSPESASLSQPTVPVIPFSGCMRNLDSEWPFVQSLPAQTFCSCWQPSCSMDQKTAGENQWRFSNAGSWAARVRRKSRQQNPWDILNNESRKSLVGWQFATKVLPDEKNRWIVQFLILQFCLI